MYNRLFGRNRQPSSRSHFESLAKEETDETDDDTGESSSTTLSAQNNSLLNQIQTSILPTRNKCGALYSLANDGVFTGDWSIVSVLDLATGGLVTIPPDAVLICLIRSPEQEEAANDQSDVTSKYPIILFQTHLANQVMESKAWIQATDPECFPNLRCLRRVGPCKIRNEDRQFLVDPALRPLEQILLDGFDGAFTSMELKQLIKRKGGKTVKAGQHLWMQSARYRLIWKRVAA